MSDRNETRRPKTAKSTREARSRLRSDLGLRYLPESAKPFTDDMPMLCPGLGIAVLDVEEDRVRRFLLQQRFITQTAIDSDDAERSHKRVDAAIRAYLKTFLTQTIGNALPVNHTTPRGNVAPDESNETIDDVDAGAQSRPNRTSYG